MPTTTRQGGGFLNVRTCAGVSVSSLTQIQYTRVVSQQNFIRDVVELSGSFHIIIPQQSTQNKLAKEKYGN